MAGILKFFKPTDAAKEPAGSSAAAAAAATGPSKVHKQPGGGAGPGPAAAAQRVPLSPHQPNSEPKHGCPPGPGAQPQASDSDVVLIDEVGGGGPELAGGVLRC